ncbi:MAG: alpha/beta hydrolase [Dehalococcoidia bacterium]
MGGMIAQELGLRHPDIPITLTLGCTWAGGPQQVHIPDEDMEELMRLADLPPEEAIDAGMPWSYSQGFIDKRRDWLRERALSTIDLTQKPENRERQMAGIMAHYTSERLGELKVPVLIVTGTGDRLVSCENSKLILAAIPHAESIEYPGAGHLYWDEDPEEVTRAVVGFARRHSPVPA